MSKKYFGYSFQVKRTKFGAITLILVVSVAITCFYLWYNKKIVVVKLDELSYKEIFGLNKFKSNECDKAYRVNYKKETCGTLCIKKNSKNKNYLAELKNSMTKDGFAFNAIATKKIGNKIWEYLKVKNNKPIMNYYKIDHKNYTYTIEYIDQAYSLNKENQNKCLDIEDKFYKSIVLND